MGKKTFIKTTRFKNKMAEKALEGEKLGLPTWERRIKKGPPPTVNNKKGKSKEFIEQIEKLETQAERNRPLINLAKAEEAEEGEIIPKTKRKGLTQTFTANDTELESKCVFISIFLSETNFYI
jgi:Rad3-related DNA helicase